MSCQMHTRSLSLQSSDKVNNDVLYIGYLKDLNFSYRHFICSILR